MVRPTYIVSWRTILIVSGWSCVIRCSWWVRGRIVGFVVCILLIATQTRVVDISWRVMRWVIRDSSLTRQCWGISRWVPRSHGAIWPLSCVRRWVIRTCRPTIARWRSYWLYINALSLAKIRRGVSSACMISHGISIWSKRWVYNWVLIGTIIWTLGSLSWVAHHRTFCWWDNTIWSKMVNWRTVSIVNWRLVFIIMVALVEWWAYSFIVSWAHRTIAIRIWWLISTIWRLESLARWKSSVIYCIISCHSIFWLLSSHCCWCIRSIVSTINTF